MIELHIYGPAFGLPSIDPRCLAATALLQTSIPSDQWVLVPSNDVFVSPFDELPALKVGNASSHTWIVGFRDIVSYISSEHAEYRLGSIPVSTYPDLGDQGKADLEAYLSFLESRGLPLLDLSLYVSSDNYTTVTRSALSDILPWPQSWTIPQRLRESARKRSEHLGLSGLDVDATREKELKKENEGLSAAIPKSLRLPKKSVTSLLGSPAEQARFRLEAVTADFFEPLEALLQGKKHFLGDETGVLDCFAVALLSQMSTSDLPQPWLSEALEKYPNLRRWTCENKEQTFGAAANLPWRRVPERSWTQLVRDVVNSIAESSPVTIAGTSIRASPAMFGDAAQTATPGVSKYERKQIFHKNKRHQQNVVREVIAACVSSAGLVGVLVYMGVLTLRWPTFRRTQPIRQTFGEAGSFLGLR
ncbi:hypothetical protein LTR70_010698 [Exophiala xenobiotica]|uniref:GST C-terminal domain-containing protein n=1 Tax=Lithohypha guttulata TaxID=1690604 RepID=A0ABR0JTJ6_9EURO|nr:hypothetical protein LTR24_010680 [Lithohypha guttulata]KAK5308975.1 hypothetical protein LTR70_010698 [Exophiala xenobiotica]